MKIQATFNGQPLPNIYVEAGIDISAAGYVFVDGRAVTCARCGGMVHREDIEGYGFSLDIVCDADFDTLCGGCLADNT